MAVISEWIMTSNIGTIWFATAVSILASEFANSRKRKMHPGRVLAHMGYALASLVLIMFVILMVDGVAGLG